MQTHTLPRNGAKYWEDFENAGKIAVQGIRAKRSLGELANELLFVQEAAIKLLRDKLRNWLGVTPRDEHDELAYNWFAEDFVTGLKGYDITRPLKPFVFRLLWRRFARYARRLDRDERHKKRIYEFGKMIRRGSVDPAELMESTEMQELVQMALFNMNPMDRSMITLWSSKMTSREIAELLDVSLIKYFQMSLKARAAFVTELKKVWSEFGLPPESFPRIKRRANRRKS